MIKSITVNINKMSIDAAFGSIEKHLTRAANHAVDVLGESVVEVARLTDKFNHGEHFNQGIQYTPKGTGVGQVTAQVFNANGVEYANFMEFGNLPVINNDKLMKFQVDGQWVSTYSRKAIGEEHLGFFTDAVEQVREKAQDIVDRELSKNREK